MNFVPPRPATAAPTMKTLPPRHNVIARVMRTCYGLDAFDAAFGEELAEAVCAERLLLLRRELLSSKNLGAVAAREAVAVPRRVLVRDASLVDDLPAQHHVYVHRKPRKTLCI